MCFFIQKATSTVCPWWGDLNVFIRRKRYICYFQFTIFKFELVLSAFCAPTIRTSVVPMRRILTWSVGAWMWISRLLENDNTCMLNIMLDDRLHFRNTNSKYCPIVETFLLRLRVSCWQSLPSTWSSKTNVDHYNHDNGAWNLPFQIDLVHIQ